MQLNTPSLFRHQCYINGEWVSADSGKTMPVNNPATNEVLTSVPVMGAIETRRAIEAADHAWPAWREKTAAERALVLRAWYRLMLEHQEDLAQLMTAEQGKPLQEARGEVLYAASFIDWFAEEGKRICGDTIMPHQADRRNVVLKQPVGVCAAITPWNFPAAMITRKAGAALAAGCTMVVKPAEDTPLTALALCELAEQAGLPAGVLNVVTGIPQEIGGELTSNKTVRKLSFTGSTAVGKLLMQQCAGSVKKVSMELGGNAPFIVFDDADLDKAVEGAIASKYRNSGQTCVCANRFLVQDGIYDEFAKRMGESLQTLRVGDGTDPEVNQGPLINMAAIEKVEAHVEDAVNKGARVLSGGMRHELGGTFYQPTLLADITPEMRVVKEEIFGPVSPLVRFETEQQAIDLANDTDFGLASYFFTENLGRSWRVSEALEYGMVGVNTGVFSTELAPFGGVKQSGIGREGSKYGIDEYLELKYVCIGL